MPENSLRWYDTEEGALPVTSEVGAVTLGDDELSIVQNPTTSLGFNTLPLYESYAQHYGVPYSGRWIDVNGGTFKAAGAQKGDVIYGVDDVLWADDPYVIERAKARLAKGETCVFHVWRGDESVDISVRTK